MANTIKLRRSSVQGTVPTTSQLALGELGINTYDGKLFLKKSTSGAETGAGTSIVDVITPLSSTTPAALGSAAVGSGTTAARADHVHAMPSAADVSALPLTFTANTISYSATVDLDMASRNGGYFTINLTGNLTFTTSNRAAGRTVTLRLICDATQRTLTVPAGWVFVGTKPANIAASKTAILSLSFFGTADSDCVAAYGVQA